MRLRPPLPFKPRFDFAMFFPKLSDCTQSLTADVGYLAFYIADNASRF